MNEEMYSQTNELRKRCVKFAGHVHRLNDNGPNYPRSGPNLDLHDLHYLDKKLWKTRMK